MNSLSKYPNEKNKIVPSYYKALSWFVYIKINKFETINLSPLYFIMPVKIYAVHYTTPNSSQFNSQDNSLFEDRTHKICSLWKIHEEITNRYKYATTIYFIRIDFNCLRRASKLSFIYMPIAKYWFVRFCKTHMCPHIHSS